MSKILVVGTGAWATALSQVLLHNKNEVLMYGINPNEIDDLKNQKNMKYFGDKKLKYSYDNFITDLSYLNTNPIDYILFAIPSDALQETLIKVNNNACIPFHMINAAKGFVNTKKDVFSNLIKNEQLKNVASYSCLLGPGFSTEVLEQSFTVVNITNQNLKIAAEIANLFTCKFFIAIPATNVIGSEIVACMKNPLAIVTGILNEKRVSVDLVAAFVTKGIEEIKSLLNAYNVSTDVLYDYCGIGDIYLTTTNNKSRNYSFGQLLAIYNHFDAAIKYNKKTVEGINATKIACHLFKKFNIQSVLFGCLNQLLNNEIDVNIFIEKVITSFVNKK